MRKVLALLFVAVLVGYFIPTHALAQATSGTVTVMVQDPTGAVIPSAKVTITDKSIGTVLTANTENSGVARFPNVAVGKWLVTVEVAGFKKFATTVDVNLNTVSDVLVKMEVGEMTQTVEVSAGAAQLVETTASQLGESFSAQKVIDLPIGGDPNQLALLAPNTVHQGDGVLGSGGSIGGQRSRNNNFTVDGVDNNDITVTGPQIGVIGDAVQQFTILQNNFSAEFGHSAAGQFNTITKTGTNELHGEAWWYLQNRNLNALDHLTREAIGRGDIPDRPRFDRNQVGGEAGGPIIKDKLFYFGAFQYITTGSAGSSQQILVPTAQGLATLAATPGVSPFTLGLLQNNAPAATAASDSVTVLGKTIPVGVFNLFIPSFNTQYQWQANVDQNWGEHDQFHYRFFWDRFRAPNLGAPLSKFNGSQFNDNRLLAISNVHIFNPRVLNEFRFSYHRNRQGFSVPDEFKDFPNIEVDELSLNIGPQPDSPQGGTSNVYQYLDNLSWTRGRHSLKFGVEYRNAISPSDFLPRGRGEYDYATLETLLLDLKPDGGNGGLRGVGTGVFAGNQWSLYSFAQDDWKVTTNLTLNLGVRYEFTSFPRDANLQALNKIANAGPFDFREPETYKRAWAPRVGFAYAPNFSNGWLHKLFGDPGKSSIRGGYSIAYDVIFQNLILLQLPPQFQQETDASSGSAPPFGTDTKFLQNGGISPTPIPPTTAADARAGTQSLITDQRPPTSYTWTLGVQREFLPNWSVEVRYLGTRGVHLPVQVRRNGGIVPPDNLFLPTYFNASQIPSPAVLATMTTRKAFLAARRRPFSSLGFFGNVTAFDPVGNSIYHSGSVNVTHRFSNTYSMSAAYTYSHTIDDSTNELFSSFINPRRPQNKGNLQDERANSALDRRNRFVLSWIWELPFFRKSNGLMKQLGGWQFSGIYQAETGQWATPISGVDSNGNFDAAGDRTIINVNGTPGIGTNVNWVTKAGQIVAPGSVSSSQVVGYIAANPNAFYVQAGAGGKATAGRNTLRTRGLNNFDFVILKDFPIRESKKVQFRADMFNAFNHPQFTVDALNFGFIQVGSPDFNKNTIFSGGHRTIQLALKVYF